MNECTCDFRYPPDHIKPCDFCQLAWIQADEKRAKKNVNTVHKNSRRPLKNPRSM